MKRTFIGILLTVVLLACQETENPISEFTGNEASYPLVQGSSYAVQGTATIKEKKDGNAVVVISLSGTEGTLQHPVHLHVGDITISGSEIAAQLNPVNGLTGKSETLLRLLANENPITYQQLIQLEANIKVHLSVAGPDRDIILAGGNIGALPTTTGTFEIGICSSE